MLKAYRRLRLKGILIYVILLPVFFLFVNTAEKSAWIGSFSVFILFELYKVFYELLLTDLEVKGDQVKLDLYNLVFKHETISFPIEDIIEIECPEYNQLKFKLKGTNGPIFKKYHLIISPWDELSTKLKHLKEQHTIQKKAENLEVGT